MIRTEADLEEFECYSFWKAFCYILSGVTLVPSIVLWIVLANLPDKSAACTPVGIAVTITSLICGLSLMFGIGFGSMADTVEAPPVCRPEANIIYVW